MSKPEIKRPLTKYEQHRSWWPIGGGLLGLILVLALISRYGGGNLRGYTFGGILLGILALVLSLLTFAYSLRKRVWQEKMPAVGKKYQGTVRSWLWAHLYLGGGALLAAYFHAGPGIFSWRMSTGKIAFWLFVGLSGSGFVWRWIYNRIPKKIQGELGNYSREANDERAAARLLEMEKLAAGKSEQFHLLKDALAAGKSGAGIEVEAEERPFVPSLEEMASSRQRAFKRLQLIDKYDWILQGSRIWHIPLTFFFLFFLGWHIIAVMNPTPGRLEGFHSSNDCVACHEQIVAQWKESMHAKALISPVTIVQTNQVIEHNLADVDSPDPKQICNNCHGPTNTRLTEQATLPLEGPLFVSDEVINEGVNCSSCHQFNGEAVDAGGGWASIFLEGLRPGRRFFGPYDDAVGNAYHISERNEIFSEPDQLCLNCHNVNVDMDGDGAIVAGDDLVLQNTFSEFLEYQAAGGTETCISCHMPVVNENRLAESATIPFQQDRVAPNRLVRDHGFVGVDYPLDTVVESDPQRPAREKLLQEAALFNLGEVFINDFGDLQFELLVANNDLGHYLPTGFAFARQMWIEVTVFDETGTIWLGSGILQSNTDDLCDDGTLGEVGNPMAEYIVGCDEVDFQLVNFQQKLVDDVALEDGLVVQVGEESWMQNLNGGAVSRVRPFDGQRLTRIEPNETRSFIYVADLPVNLPAEITVSARLMFRNLPPYFLRALADHQPEDEEPQLGPMIGNLQIVEMAAVEERFSLR